MPFQTINPATGEVLKIYSEHSFDEGVSALEQLHRSFFVWRRQCLEERAAILLQWASHLEAAREGFARQMTVEMGKPIAQSRAEVAKCVTTLRTLVANAEEWSAPEAASSPYQKSFVRWEPLGVVLAIMPWNFPLWQVVRFAGPAILGGNVVLLKHAELTSGVAEMIEASIPVGSEGPLLLQARLSHEDVSRLMADSRVRGVTFTGSTRGGRAVGARAGECLKKSVLELGGSDAYIVLADADLEKAARVCASARLGNNGQSCVAAKRFVVEASVRDRFLELFLEQMSGYEMAPPERADCRLGPLASKRFQEGLARQVERRRAVGGHLALGGVVPEGPGAYFPPTVIVHGDTSEAGSDEELFGPVAEVYPVRDRDEALRVANASPYGLGAAVFSADEAAAIEWSRELEVGMVAINDQVRSDVGLPFGGVKDSGYGRELGRVGFLEFCQAQSVGVGPLK